MVPLLLLCLFLTLHQTTAVDQIPDNRRQPVGRFRCRRIEFPKYTVVHVDHLRNFEVREYENPLWVFLNHHHTATSFEQALSTQAPILSSYLKGKNDLNTTITETTPVLTIVLPGLYHTDHVNNLFGDNYLLARYLPYKYQVPKQPCTRKTGREEERLRPLQNSSDQISPPPQANGTVRFWQFPPENHFAVVRRFRQGSINDTTIEHALASLRKSLEGTQWESRVRPYGSFAVVSYNFPGVPVANTKNEILLLAEKEWISLRGLHDRRAPAVHERLT